MYLLFRFGSARFRSVRLGSVRFDSVWFGSVRFLVGLTRFDLLCFSLLKVNRSRVDYLVPRAWSTRVALQRLQRVRLFPIRRAFYLHAGGRGGDSGLGYR